MLMSCYSNFCVLVLFSGFSIFPGGVWVLETDRQYIITVDVYDKLNHKLYVAEVKCFMFINFATLLRLLKNCFNCYFPMKGLISFIFPTICLVSLT